MAPKLSCKSHAPIGSVSASREIDRPSGQKKVTMDQPRLDQSSNTYTEIPTPKVSSPKHGGKNSCRGTACDDNGNGDVSDADAGEPDDEGEGDAEGDAFAPSDRAIYEHGDQAGRTSDRFFDRTSTFDENRSNAPSPFKDQFETTKARLIVSDSDDDYYNGVDFISGAEEDESGVEQLEERNIIESEEVPANFEASDGWEGFDINEGSFLEDVPLIGRTDSYISDSEVDLHLSASIFDKVPSPMPPSPCPRRVHFIDETLPLSNDSDRNADEGDIDDLFSRNSAPHKSPGENLDSGGLSLGHEDDDGSCAGNSSGYETDYGDTTDDEDIPASATKRPQSLLRQPSLSSSLELGAPAPAASPAKKSSRCPRKPAGYCHGPRIGTFTVDSTKPCAVIDSTGANMIIRPATRPIKINNPSISKANDPTSTANVNPTDSQQKLMTAPENKGNETGGYLVQASMYDHRDPVLAPGSDIAPPSAPLPVERSRPSSMGHVGSTPSMSHLASASSVFLPIDAMTNIANNSYMIDDDSDDDDDELLWNIDDFIHMGDDSSEGGEQPAGDESSLTSPITAEGSGPVLTSSNLIKHLDRHYNSGFRHGQPNYQPQSLVHQNNYALDDGRQASDTAQMGHQQKRKMSGSFLGATAAKRPMISQS